MSARGIRVRLVFSSIFTSDVFFAFIVSHLYSSHIVINVREGFFGKTNKKYQNYLRGSSQLSPHPYISPI